MGKDYYALLGISKTADDDEIKKAYRKMALKWHPDRHQGADKDSSEKKFKDISEAYEVLSDKQKRTIYDQYGEEALKNGMPTSSSNGAAPGGSYFNFPGGGSQTFSFSSSSGMPGGSFGGFTPSNPEDIFQQIFFDGLGGGFMGGSSGPRSQRGRARPRTQMDQSSMPFGRQPTGSANNQEIVRTLPVSLADLYTGVTKKLKVTRKTLGPNKTLEESQKILQIDVKPGWKSGTKVRFSGEGDDLGDGPQDIVILIEEKPDPVFKRDKDNLKITLNLSLKEALCGFKKTITTLDKRHLNVENHTNVVRPGQESSVSGEGMPISKVPNGKGNLIITYNVEFPKSITQEQKDKLRDALP